MTERSTLTQRQIFLFWLPLAATWLMMSLEGPFLAAVIARLTLPEVNLAAFGVAFSFALLAESPVIMMLSAATALVTDRISYLRLRAFTHGLNAVITLALLVLLAPPVFEFVAGTLIGLPDPVAERTWLALLVLLPWPAAIGYRRFYQGILIGHGQTRRVAYGTVIRLAAMAATALTMVRFTAADGAVVGAAALSAGVTAEGLTSRFMAGRAIRSLLSGDDGPEPAMSYAEISRFYLPLALTAMLALGVHPLVTFFVGHGRLPLESLAVLPVINSLVFIFRSLGLAYQEVGIALMGNTSENFTALRRFAWNLGAVLVVGLALIAWTPVGRIWFEIVSGLSPELAAFALAPARILVLIPGLAVILSFQRAVLVHQKRTIRVTLATVIEVGSVVTVLTVAIFALDVVGVVAAAAALLVGRLGANVFLGPVLRTRPESL